MVSPGVVSISARFPDADGVNVSPGHQYGIIRNSLGVIKDNISPSSSPTLVSVADWPWDPILREPWIHSN